MARQLGIVVFDNGSIDTPIHYDIKFQISAKGRWTHHLEYKVNDDETVNLFFIGTRQQCIKLGRIVIRSLNELAQGRSDFSFTTDELDAWQAGLDGIINMARATYIIV